MPLSTSTAGRALARAALAGNPSDVFGGAVLATVVPSLEARVVLSPASGVVVGDRSWPDIPAVVAAAHDGSGRLVSATIAHLASQMAVEGIPVPAAGLHAQWSTAIPRSVGLAGSSALVIAALRALTERWNHPIDDLAGPRLALEVEVDRLGIAAGPQDRVVQWHGRTVLMDFSSPSWTVTPVDPPEPVELFVAWTTRSSPPSQATHGPLRERGDDPTVAAAMVRLADVARTGAAALSAGDREMLGAALDASFDERAGCLDLHPDHLELVETARAAGACVNYTGSGGAVIGLARDLDRIRAWAHTNGHGFQVLRLAPSPTVGAFGCGQDRYRS